MSDANYQRGRPVHSIRYTPPLVENDTPWGSEVDALQEIDADTELHEVVPRLDTLMRQVTATARGDLKAELALRASLKELYELSARYEVLRRAVTHFGNLPT